MCAPLGSAGVSWTGQGLLAVGGCRAPIGHEVVRGHRSCDAAVLSRRVISVSIFMLREIL